MCHHDHLAFVHQQLPTQLPTRCTGACAISHHGSGAPGPPQPQGGGAVATRTNKSRLFGHTYACVTSVVPLGRLEQRCQWWADDANQMNCMQLHTVSRVTCGSLTMCCITHSTIEYCKYCTYGYRRAHRCNFRVEVSHVMSVRTYLMMGGLDSTTS